jgi:hypothetical protein
MIASTRTTLPSPAPRLLYSRKEAAYLLCTSLRNIAYRIANGTMKVRRQGGRVVITHAELLRQAALDDNTPVAPKRSASKPPMTAPAEVNEAAEAA